MAIPPTGSGELIDVGPLGGALDRSRIAATPLVKAATLEVVRLVVPAGTDVASHTAPGDVTVQCLEGAVDFTAGGRTQRLVPGRLLYLAAGDLHALHGVEDASVLVTIVRCDRGGRDAV
jgi:quercetin dioxygenase-like cupin family protein